MVHVVLKFEVVKLVRTLLLGNMAEANDLASKHESVNSSVQTMERHNHSGNNTKLSGISTFPSDMLLNY